ncbi:MAG: DUF2971 domain-containing protein [Bryobacteraceae bacterium]|nr:DUF2971 domain-containing protein [Bryobacteraceae bacterium]
MLFVPNDENCRLNNDQKQAVDHAFAVFMQAIDPLLQKQFRLDGFPEKLCHYTDFRGLQGILETGALRATYTQAMNDSSEAEYGQRVVKNYVAGFPDQDATRRLGVAMESSPQRYFACCFCERSDLLSMWITYAQRGGGYCLEFDGVSGLLSPAFPQFPNRLPFKMTYGMALPEPVESILACACDFARAGDVEASVSASWMRILSLRFKHPAFSHEEERRIVIPNPSVSAMKFQAGDTGVKPYIELRRTAPDGSRLLPLRRIVFGPTLRQDRILVETIGLMLERYGYKGVPVEPCGIPYRV